MLVITEGIKNPNAYEGQEWSGLVEEQWVVWLWQTMTHQPEWLWQVQPERDSFSSGPADCNHSEMMLPVIYFVKES